MQTSQQPLPCQFNFASGLARFVATFACANGNTVSYLNFILDCRMWTRTVVWEVDAGKRVWTEIVRAGCCIDHRSVQLSRALRGELSERNSQKSVAESSEGSSGIKERTYRLPSSADTSLNRLGHSVSPAVPEAGGHRGRTGRRIGIGRRPNRQEERDCTIESSF